jgi:hypothetical protein
MPFNNRSHKSWCKIRFNYLLLTIVHWVDTVDHELQEAMAEVAMAVTVAVPMAVAVARRARCRARGDATARGTTSRTASPRAASHTRLA